MSKQIHLLVFLSFWLLTAAVNPISAQSAWEYTFGTNNCRFDPSLGEKPLPNWLIKVENANKTLYGLSDSLGNYQIYVDFSVYRLTLQTPNAYWQPCTITQALPAPTTQALAFQVPTQLIPIVIQAISPNPTEDAIQIKLDSWTKQTVDFNFSDITGKVIHAKKKRTGKRHEPRRI